VSLQGRPDKICSNFEKSITCKMVEALMQRHKFGKLFRRGLFVAAIILISGSASASPQWNVNFDSATSGQPPPTATAVPGVVHTAITSMTVSGAGNSLLVQNSFTAGSAILSSKPVVITQIVDGAWKM